MARTPCLTLFVVAAAGVCLGDAWPGAAPWWRLAASVLGAVYVATWLRGSAIAAAYAGCSACAAAFAGYAASVPGLPAEVLPATAVPALVRVVGPVQRRGAVGAAAGSGHGLAAAAAAAAAEVRLRLRAELIAVREGGVWQARQATATVWLGGSRALGHGDVVLLRADVLPLRAQAAPWLPTPAQLRRYHGINARLRADGDAVRVHRGRGAWHALDLARQRGGAYLEGQLPPADAAIAKALLLGDTAQLDEESRDAWAAAGTAHLLAVSGLHVALVARLVRVVFQLVLTCCLPAAAERGDAWAAAQLVSTAAAGGYAALTGGQVPAVRAACMVGLAQLGSVVCGQGRGQGGNLLGAAGLLALLHAPLTLFAPSFLLSFVAVAALVQAPPPPAVDPAATQRRRWRRAWAAALDQVATSCRVGGVTLPLGAAFFGQLPPWAPWTNLLAVPLACGLITPLGLTCLALAALGGPAAWLAGAAAAALRPALAWLTAAVAWMASWPGARCRVAPPPAWLWCSLVAAGLAAARCRSSSQRRRWVALGWLGTVTLLLWGWPGPRLGDGLRVWHLDVGHGDATLVRFPDGGWLLVDGGGALSAQATDPGARAVAPALRALGVRRLRAVLLTHPHPDHYGGLAYVLAHWPCAALWLTADAQDTPAVAALARQVTAAGGRVQAPPAQVAWGGVQLRSYQPLAGSNASHNDRSVVVRLAFKRTSLLLAGDVEARGEAALAAVLPPTDVLKVAHHGSPTSSTAAWLAALRPRLAVVSAGEANRFGFPAADVVARLRGVGAVVRDTGRHGTVALVSDGDHWQVGWGGQTAAERCVLR